MCADTKEIETFEHVKRKLSLSKSVGVICI